MKILFTRFPLESAHGGAEVQTLSLMEGLLERGHAVAFLGSCPVLLQECRKRNIPCVELDIGAPPVTKWGTVSFLWRRRKMQQLLIKTIRVFRDLDAICMLSLSEKLLVPPEKFSNVRIFWIEHDRIGRWLIKNPWFGSLRRNSEHVTTVAVSELSKNFYIHLGWPEDRIVTIPNGVDPLRFAHPATISKPNQFHIGCVARLTSDKGIDLLISAVRGLPDARLTIVGGGRELERLLCIIEPVNDQITILKYIDDLGAFYHSLDVLVLPSRDHDPFGLVAAEAMMLGIAVVVTDACGIASYLTNGSSGIVVEAGSASALLEALRRLQKSPEERRSLAQQGKSLALESFTVERMVNNYVALLSPQH
ncbi:MAG: glycosyltransferase family 4 protein [Candidatus Peribacteraceae bacterium]